MFIFKLKYVFNMYIINYVWIINRKGGKGEKKEVLIINFKLLFEKIYVVGDEMDIWCMMSINKL